MFRSRTLALSLALASLASFASAQVRPTPLPIDPTVPITPTLPIAPTFPITPGGGGIIGGGGNNIIIGPIGSASISASAGILAGAINEASATLSGQAALSTVAPTYTWTITGGRITSSTTAATITYVADTAGTVTLTVSINAAGLTYNASSTATSIAASTAGAITAPASAVPATAANSPTLTVSVPAARNGDRTFRWSASGDAVITNGQNNATASLRAGSPVLKEISCDVRLQNLVTVTLRSYLLVNGAGAPLLVTINNGSGSGTYNGGSRVDIFANPPPAGQVFDRWTGDVSAFGANAPLAPFIPHGVVTLGTTPVTLTANYKAAPAWTLTTVPNFNVQTQPATATTSPASVSTTLSYYVPADAVGLVFLLHDTGSSANFWFNTPEASLLTRDLVAAGYGVVALNSLNRTPGTWSASTTLATNLDALNHVAALNKFIQDGLPAATRPAFFLGYGAGAEAAARYADLLATASPARNVAGAVLYCATGSQSLAITSKVPHFFALAANDDTLGSTGLASARSNAQILAGRGIAANAITNTVTPVHPGRFRALSLTNPTFTDADAAALWTGVKSAGLLDANNYVKSLPGTAAIAAGLPEPYRARAADISAQLSVAAAAQEFFSEANLRVLNFLNNRVAGTAAPTPGRIVNLSTRTQIAYVGDTFTAGFNLTGTARATLLIRAVGPGLTRFGVPNVLAAPRLEINDSAGRLIASNERWDAPGNTATAAQLTTLSAGIGAFPLTPGFYDAAVVLTNLAAGPYTATVRGVNGAVGDVLVEVYDVTKNATRLSNLSILGTIAEPGATLIPGLVVQGANPRTVLIRAIGPSLSDFGLASGNLVADPGLVVQAANGTVLDSNNNWAQAGTANLAPVFPAVGAFPLKSTASADAALVTALTNGTYTIQAGAVPTATTQTGTTGSLLVEIYEVP